MKNSLFHRFVDFLVKHDDLHQVPARVDISQDFFPISPKEFQILRTCLKLYISSVPRLSDDFESDSDFALSLLIKLMNAWRSGKTCF